MRITYTSTKIDGSEADRRLTDVCNDKAEWIDSFEQKRRPSNNNQFDINILPPIQNCCEVRILPPSVIKPVLYYCLANVPFGTWDFENNNCCLKRLLIVLMQCKIESCFNTECYSS